MAGHIVETRQDLIGILDLFDGVEVVDGNKVSDGKYYVGKDYEGEKPVVAVFTDEEGGE